jgi:hypothetical protein
MPMRASKSAIALALACAVGSGCDEPAGLEPGPPRAGVLQLIGFAGPGVTSGDGTVRWTVPPAADVRVPGRVLAAPDTVAAGETFDVAVTTIGLSGCWSASGQDLRERAGVIELTPTDAHSGAGVCTDVLLELEHRSSLAIALPGEWTVRVRGRRVRLGHATWEEPVAAEKTVVVR